MKFTTTVTAGNFVRNEITIVLTPEQAELFNSPEAVAFRDAERARMERFVRITSEGGGPR